MRVGRAWCVELNRAVGITEAQAAYFEQAEPRKRFSFLCADPICRERARPKLLGVHDDRLFFDEAFPSSAHFVMTPQAPHHPMCESLLRERAAQIVANDVDRARNNLNASRRFSAKRPFEVFDVYLPAVGESASTTNDAGADDGPLGELLGTAMALAELDANERVMAIAQQMRTRALRTRRLIDIVSCFSELGAVDRQKALVHLPGGKLGPYANFIQPLSKYQEDGDPVIRVGGVRVAREDDGFLVRFHDRVVIGGERHEVLLHLSDARIAASSMHGLLRAQLLAALGGGCHARVFFFGGITPDPAAPGFAEIRLSNLDNLVVHPMRVGRGGDGA